MALFNIGLINPVVIVTIVVIVAVIAGAWYFSGRILNPNAEEPVESPSITPLLSPEDIWEGFNKAHQDHPPKWSENDSWAPEFSR